MTARKVALVEDDDDLRAATAQLLQLADFTVTAFADAKAALAVLDADWEGVVLSDVRMPGLSGIDLHRTLRQRDEELPVILITGHGDVAMAVDAMKAGVWDFLTKPFAPDAMIAAVTRASRARALALDNRRLQAEASAGSASALIGNSPTIRRLRDMIPTLTNADLDLLIEGESGTGKELLARMIHQSGKRRRHRFMSINCAGLNGSLEDEILSLSGGASLIHANRGTVLLDDLDHASAQMQMRLAQVLEDRALSVPGREPVSFDVRVIATVSTGSRAGDVLSPALLHRIAGMRIAIPPLRDRREDIPDLFAHFVGQAAARLRVPVPRLTPDVRDRLDDHDWPGNAHELAHYAEQFVLGLLQNDAAASETGPPPPLTERVDAFEREAIIAAIRAANGRIGSAIQALGMARKTFYYKVNKLGIDLQAVRQGIR
ncbi:MAG: sigma-54-dependent Fis family transcriptional regulator [Novosphingobium sp.]|nr:sigma-54-dependent Fis family transcriptional regulator [Novosphingobium sp.]